MTKKPKLVSHMPLKKIWKGDQILEAERVRYLKSENIRQILSSQEFSFVLANIGDELKWVEQQDCFGLWKNHLASNLAEEEEFYLDDFPNHYAWVASEWRTAEGGTVVLFEMFH